jgi:hypothetical protein
VRTEQNLRWSGISNKQLSFLYFLAASALFSWGAVHAGIAPAFTFMIDQLAYNKTDLRTTTAKFLAEERASEVILEYTNTKRGRRKRLLIFL